MKLRLLYPAVLIVVVLILGVVGISRGWLSSSSTTDAPLVENPAVPSFESGTQMATATPTNATIEKFQTKESVYTLADVAEHNQSTSCWTAVQGTVYDLTPFIASHPGGMMILAVCGIDGTKLFESQHGGNKNAQKELASLKIGVLAP